MSNNASPGLKTHPKHRIKTEGIPKRIRAAFGGEIIADSTGTVILTEASIGPVVYFPRQDVRLDFLTRTRHRSYCPFKGTAAYWSLRVGGKTVENAVWSYEAPFDELLPIKDYMAFYGNKIDAFIEGNEDVTSATRDGKTATFD